MIRHHAPLMPALLGLLGITFGVSLLVGAVWLRPQDLLPALFTRPWPLAALIVIDLRLPRAILACLAGGSLGLAGAVLQGLTRNPLAEPGLLGVTTGAALGAVIALYFGLTAAGEIWGPVMGIVGALGASARTFLLGRGGGILSLILAGAAVSGLMSACISVALNLAPNPYAAYEIMTWLMGSLVDRSWHHVLLVLPFVAGGAVLLAMTMRALDALALGEDQAMSLGINLERLHVMVLGGTALAVGATTAVTGAIGFVGLLAPHLLRPFVAYQPGRLLAPSALLGALLLLTADILTRLIQIGPEIKLGVVMSLLGTPFFFWLVVRVRRSGP